MRDITAINIIYMENLLMKILDEITLWAGNNNFIFIESIIMEYTHPRSEYPWLYYTDWADRD